MKLSRFVFVIIASICLSCATQPEWKEATRADTKRSLFDYNAYWIDNDFSIQVTTLANQIVVKISDPKILPLDDKNGKYLDAARVKLHSGILAANQIDNTVFREVYVDQGVLEFTINNYANQQKVPVVEHLWGEGIAKNGTFGSLALDPQNKWITYEIGANGKIDLDSLAIGIAMYPDKPAIPLKALKKGKLIPGRHPELNNFYVQQSTDEAINPTKYVIKRVAGRAEKSDSFDDDVIKAQINGLAQAATSISRITVNPDYLPGQTQGIQAIINEKIARSGWYIAKYRVLKQPQAYRHYGVKEVVEVPLEIIFHHNTE